MINPYVVVGRHVRAAATLKSSLAARAAVQERRRPLDSILETDALRYDACGKGAVKARGKGGVEQDEDAGVAGAADQPSEGLLETQPGQHVVVARAAEYRLARLVQDVRTRPRHTVEDDEPERAAGHVDAIADGIGAEEAGIFLGAKDVDQRRGIHAVDMLGEQRQTLDLERGGDALMHRLQARDRGEEAE